MKELKQIREALKTQIAIEKELRDTIYSKIPEASSKLVSKLFDLVEKGSKNLRLSITPRIVLNYMDSKVYLRILPIEAGARLDSGDIKSYFPSISLADLFEVADYELYDQEFRKKLCHELAKGIQKYLASEECGCKSSIDESSGENSYNTAYSEYVITPKII